MTSRDDKTGQHPELRRRAEEIVKTPPRRRQDQQTLHELQVYQIELEVQNEDLRRAHEELDAARVRYFDLYDLAPVGYCTVSDKGLILETNLTHANLLGVARAALLNRPITRFILKEDQEIYYLHSKRLFETNEPQACELRMVKQDETAFWVRLEATIAQDAAGSPVYRIVLSDITERKSREEEHDLTARLLVSVNTPGDFRKLMSDLTASLQGWSGCEAVGIRLRAGDDYPYYETCGFPPAFVDKETRLCAYGPDGKILCDGTGNPVLECMCGNILCGRFDPAKPFFTAHGSFWSNNTTALLASTTEADRQARTRNRCNGEGYESVALIPLHNGHQILGLLQFNDHRADRFTLARIAHFERLAYSLAIALSRRQAEESLRESEERYQRITEAITDYIYTVSVADGRAVETTHGPGCLTVTGYRANEFANDPFLWFRIVAKEDRPAVEEQARRILAGEDPPPLEHRIVSKSGTLRWMRSTFVPHRDEGGALMAYDGLIQDITERKQAEEELMKSETRFRELFDDAPIGYHELDGEGRIVRVNHTELLMLGYSADEMMGRPVWEFIEERDLSQKVVLEKLAGTSPPGRNLERIYRRKDGTKIPVLIQEMLLRDKDGNINGIRTTMQDITERKQAEEQKAKLEAQLQQAQKMESIGRLASGVAHDFNNMLGVILGHSEMAMEQVDPSQMLHTDLEEIRKAANRSADLTRQLLAFARKQTIAPKVLDLNEAVESMFKMLRRLIGENIHLDWRPGENLWQVKMDPSQIDQILANLCVNTRDAISGIGEMAIETQNVRFDEDDGSDHAGLVPGEYVLLAMSDDGCGMDKEILGKLFEPFFTTKGPGKGTGLGLATVYGIVKQNNGFINVYSEPDRGTTFKIYLPRHVGKTGQPKTEGLAEAAGRGRETILIVEDEPAILKIAAMLLERQGYTVLTAGTPGEAIRMAREYAGEIHLLMTDVVMPEMNGRDLAKNLLALYPYIKRLFMSGYTADVIAHHGALDEGVFFIEKPFSKNNLAAKVREALDHE